MADMISNMNETESKPKYGVDGELVPCIEQVQIEIERETGLDTAFIRVMNMLLKEALEARKAKSTEGYYGTASNGKS